MDDANNTGATHRRPHRILWALGLALLLAAPLTPGSVGAGTLDDDAGSGRDAPDHRSGEVTIRLAEVYEGNLSGHRDLMDFYAFDGAAGDHLQFRLKGFDACWLVRDNVGRIIADDCDDDGVVDTDFTLDDDTTWFLVVKRPINIGTLERYRFTLADNGTAADPWPGQFDPLSALPSPPLDELPTLPDDGNETDPGNDTEPGNDTDPVQEQIDNATGLLPSGVPDVSNETTAVGELLENVTDLVPDEIPDDQVPDPDNITGMLPDQDNITGMLPDQDNVTGLLPDPDDLTEPAPDPGNDDDVGANDANSGRDAPDERALDNETIFLQPDTFYQGAIDGPYNDAQDWYAITAIEGDVLDIRVKNYGFTCYYVFDADGDQLVRYCSSATTWAGTQATRVKATIPANGTYHILVASDLDHVFGMDRSESFTTDYELAYTFGGTAPVSGTHPLLG